MNPDWIFHDARGQGYDGAAVVSGIYVGIQKRIIDLSPNAVYVHCVCHRLNLVLRDAAECCPEMQTFFGTVEDVYKFFGCSAPNWALLKAFGDGNDVKSCTLKHLSHKTDREVQQRFIIRFISTAVGV
jgi:hypothetical protein